VITLRTLKACLLASLAALVLAVPAVAQSPAQQQYEDRLPNTGKRGDAAGGGGGAANEGGAGAGGAGKKGDASAGDEGAGSGSGQEGELASSEAGSDDDGGLSTLAIILIVLSVIAAGALGFVWWRGRQGPSPSQ
jgi:cobalamin biosynthesis Mg chelatase CobN